MKIRASSIRVFFDNPQLWYRDTMGESTRRTGQNALIGSLVHHYIETKDLKLLSKKYDELLEECEYDLTDSKEVIVKRAVDMCMAWNEFKDKPTLLSQEQRLSYLTDDIEVTGQYDGITEDAIVDFKTGKATINSAESHKYQLSIYAHLVHKCTGARYEKGIIYHIAQPLKSGECRIKKFEIEISPEFGESLVNQMLRRLWLLKRMPQKDIEALFPANPFSYIQEAVA